MRNLDHIYLEKNKGHPLVLDGQSEKTEGTAAKETGSGKIPKPNIMFQFKENVRLILENSNATPIKGHWGIGYGCYYCSYQNPSAIELKSHTLNSHQSGTISLRVKSVWNIIMKLDISGLECNICLKNFTSLNTLTEHLIQVHDQKLYTDTMNQIIPFRFDTEDLQCIVCAKQYDRFKTLSEHMNEHYSNYKCSECGRSYINKKALHLHEIRHKTGVFTCSQCSKVFDTEVKLRDHKRMRHIRASKSLKCGYCKENFMNAVSKSKHEVSVHGAPKPSFECKACMKIYDSQRALKTHTTRFHMMLKPYTCSHCGTGFFYKYDMLRHEVMHTGQKKFTCDICKKSFATKKTITAHLIKHLRKKAFQCNECNKIFKYNAYLIRHIKNKHGTETN